MPFIAYRACVFTVPISQNMPTYEYRRQDGTTFEIIQRITDEALTTCPTTQQPVCRLISGGTGLIFKGSGFYQTDYVSRDESANGKKPEANNEGKPDAKAESEEPAKAETETD